MRRRSRRATAAATDREDPAAIASTSSARLASDRRGRDPAPPRCRAWRRQRMPGAACGPWSDSGAAVCCIAAGVSAGRSFQRGSSFTTAARMSVTVSPAKARAPVSISNSTQPNAQRSVRASTVWPRACSGTHVGRRAEQHAGTRQRRGTRDRRCPNPIPDSVPPRSSSNILASPKSSTFTVPSARSLILAGFRSRWTHRARARHRAHRRSATAIGSASASGIAPRASRRARSSPSTSSMMSARLWGPASPA